MAFVFVRVGRQSLSTDNFSAASAQSGGNAFFPKRKVYGQTNHACITCNTYSVPYKGKSLKKRLSPKQVNTLIHSYVTFYIFLIFQYLSLWKSVFSHN